MSERSRGSGSQRPPAVLPRPDRLRSLQSQPFGWIAAGLHRQGWLRLLDCEATAAYTFLCLAADRSGVSYYRRERIGRELGLSDAQVHRALKRLEDLDLVAYRPFRPGAADGYRQVLSLPKGEAPALVDEHVTDLAARLGRLPPDVTR